MNIFANEATQERAENARLASFVGALALGDLVKSTLGPKGMNKILHSTTTGEITVTNDGATILKSIPLDNAAAKILVNISKVQDDEVGDGTTSCCVLAAELLREAEKLVTTNRIHPQTVVEGYRIASQVALKTLEANAKDHSSDPIEFRKDLINIAKTTLSSKVLSADKDYFANLAVDAVLRLKGSTNLDHIQIIKKPGGQLTDSYLDEGFILEKKIGTNCPKVMTNAKILIANTSMDTDKVKIFGARIRVDGTSKLAELERAEREKMKAKVAKIKAHGINCFVNRQLVYNYPESLFAEAGIMCIEHADFEGVERLALVTGGEITSTFDQPDQVKLGQCDRIEEVMIGEDVLLKFSGVAAGEACTVVIRGATAQMIDEAERSLHDALAVLSQTVKETRITFGGGCAEMLMANAVDDQAKLTKGKKAIAVESFGHALRQLPTILADNAGYDSAELVAQLRAAHYAGESNMGLDMFNAKISSMEELGVYESYKLKKQVVLSASEAAEMILRVDDILRSTPRKREGR
ncbi:chaperonin Cpn60/TCP-1 family [Melampsora americana]|nr:chaperonin Cpn60/TCP-1 family [Melampsora americana]